MPAEQTADALAGQVVGGRYRLIRRIGKGGMGVVYEAEHVGLDKRVAVKFLLDQFADDPDVVERFHREARTASRIGHKNIIDVTDVGHGGDGRPFLVMELLDGADLGEVLKQTGPMPAARAVHFIRQVLRGLDAAHAKGIVHRDMKPENVFVVDRDGDPDTVKVMDFGISKVIAATESKVRLTATGAVIGTPIYMAPEQAMAHTELDHRVDLYAVGVMLFELLAGRPPFLASTYLGLVTQHLQAPPPSLAQFRPDLPAPVVAAVARALEKDPARRFGSAAEFARALPAEATLRELDAVPTLGDTDGVRAGTAGMQAALPWGTPPGVSGPIATAPARRRGRGLWIAAAGALVVAGMVVVAVATGVEEAPAADAAAKQTEPPVTTPGPVVTPPAPRPDVVSLGRIDVRTQPPGVRVFLDNEYRGTAPILLTGVTGGEHELRLELDGRQTVSTRVLVGGEVVRVDEALPEIGAPTPQPGSAASASGAASAGAGGSSGSRTPKRGTTGSKDTSTTPPEPKTQPEPEPEPEPKKQAEPKRQPDKTPGTRPGQKPNPFD